MPMVRRRSTVRFRKGAPSPAIQFLKLLVVLFVVFMDRVMETVFCTECTGWPRMPKDAGASVTLR